MEIFDYNRQLDTIRKGFHEAKGNHKRELEELKEHHEAKQAKQKKTYRDSVDEISDEAKAYGKRLTSQTQEASKRRNGLFNDKLKEKEKEFYQTQKSSRKNFNKELKNIREGHSSLLKRKDEKHDEDVDRIRGTLKKRININQQNFQEDLKEIHKSSREQVERGNENALNDRRELVLKNRNENFDRVREDTIERNKLKRRYARELERIQKSYKNSLKDLERANRELRDAGLEKRDRQNQVKQATVDELASDLREKFKRHKKRLNIDNEREKIKKDNLYRNSLMKVRHNASQLLAAQKGENESTNLAVLKAERINKQKETQLKRLKDFLLEKELHRKNEVTKMAQEYKRLKMKDKSEYADKLRKIQNEAYRLRMEDMEKSNKKSDKLIEDYRGKLEDLQVKNKESLDNIRGRIERLMRKQERDRFDYLNEHVKGNQRKLGKIKKDYGEEKTQIIDKSRRDLYLATRDIRNSLNRKIEHKKNSYTESLDILKGRYEKMENRYERKLANLKEELTKELNYRDFLAQRGQEERNRIHKEVLSDEGHKTEKRLIKLKKEFNKKLAKIDKENILLRDSIVREFQEKIQRMNREHRQNIKKTVDSLNNRFKSFKHGAESLLETQRTQYEGKIKNIRESNAKANQNLIDEYVMTYQKASSD